MTLTNQNFITQRKFGKCVLAFSTESFVFAPATHERKD